MKGLTIGPFVPKLAVLFGAAFILHATVATGDPESDPTLLQLAKAHFNSSKTTTLSSNAEVLFREIANGQQIDYLGTLVNETIDFTNAAKWPEKRLVKAEWIVWICTDSKAIQLVPHSGIDIRGARIDGRIDLAYAHVPFPIALNDCAIQQNMWLVGLHIPELDFSGSHISGLNASGSQIEGNVSLTSYSENLEAKGTVLFDGATIGLNLVCENGRFVREFGEKNAVFSVDGAKIGGDLDFRGARLINPVGRVLSAQNAKIGGNVFLNGGFEAEGSIAFVNASIERFLITSDIRSPNKAVFHLESASRGLRGQSTNLDSEHRQH